MQKRVILLIESSRAYGRGCLRGVAAYAKSHGPWTMLHLERGLTEAVPRWIHDWDGDGIISRIENKEIANAIYDCGLPTVDLRGLHLPMGGAMVDTDHAIAARMVAEHFLELGFRNFAFCGFHGIDFSEKRSASFQKHIEERGFSVEVYPPQDSTSEKVKNILESETHGEKESSAIESWLRSLPRPLALFACNDVRGRQVIDTCKLAGFSVPEEVAVVGVDDDEVICELCHPPLSSVEPDTWRIGYEGAAMLEQLMAGEAPSKNMLYVPPLAILRRLSSETTATEDADLAAAVQIIREQACKGITVHEVVRTLNVSRSTLERRFLRTFHRSPASEIERVRMERAKLLLTETSYKLAKIAKMTGYKNDSQFVIAFKRCHKITPGQFRENQS